MKTFLLIRFLLIYTREIIFEQALNSNHHKNVKIFVIKSIFLIVLKVKKSFKGITVLNC